MEFRKMRRSRQQLPEAACIAVLQENTAGVLAVSGDGGYPYAVPLSYVYEDNALYFHCAKTGHKLDALKRCDRASFCVIDQDRVVPEKYTTYYRSVIVFGRAKVMEDPAEIRSAIEKLAMKYAPGDSEEGRDAAIHRDLARLCMIKMEIEHMTGKEAVELIRPRAEGQNGSDEA